MMWPCGCLTAGRQQCVCECYHAPHLSSPVTECYLEGNTGSKKHHKGCFKSFDVNVCTCVSCTQVNTWIFLHCYWCWHKICDRCIVESSVTETTASLQWLHNSHLMRRTCTVLSGTRTVLIDLLCGSVLVMQLDATNLQQTIVSMNSCTTLLAIKHNRNFNVLCVCVLPFTLSISCFMYRASSTHMHSWEVSVPLNRLSLLKLHCHTLSRRLVRYTNILVYLDGSDVHSCVKLLRNLEHNFSITDYRRHCKFTLLPNNILVDLGHTYWLNLPQRMAVQEVCEEEKTPFN